LRPAERQAEARTMELVQRLWTTLLSAALCLTSLTTLGDTPADPNAAWLAEHYTKYEHRIPMRDGARLFTRVYVPKDDSETYPILLTRTPYTVKPYGVDNYNDPDGTFAALAKDRFIMVSQDVRGRFGSEGTFVHMRPFNPKKGPKDTDESTDAWDTIDWLVKNAPNNNGKVGMFGISYPGFYTSMGMIDSHPALKAASPQAPITDWFIGDDIHHNGAFFLSQNFGFFWWFELPSEDPLRDTGRKFVFNNADGYDFFLRMGSLGNSESLHFKKRVPIWTEFLDHPNYDAYWQARNIRPHLKNVRCAVLTVGGWFDGEDLFGALETYRWTEKLNPGITNLLVMGPWTHGQWSHGPGNRVGDVDFHVKTGEHYREKIELPFFRQFLKGDTNRFQPEAQVFETGTHRWRRFESWPPAQATARTLYFHPRGRLILSTPPPAGDSSADEFPSDPAKPVPFSQEVTTDYPRGYPTHDQRFAASRPDVLVYETEPLEEDLTLAGPIQASLHVTTTGTDADWVVKVVDVYPPDFPDLQPNPAHLRMGGYQQLIRGDVMPSRFRKSFEQPEPMVPGQITPVSFTLPDILHTFRRGHRVQVQIQSSWFPLVDRNPQTFIPNIARAQASDFRKAMHQVHRTPGNPSALTIRVLPNGGR
jgi:putative CocE/NonD family hydrolase